MVRVRLRVSLVFSTCRSATHLRLRCRLASLGHLLGPLCGDAGAAQLALFFRLPVIVPMLIVAEVLSWFAILTNRALFNMLENSLWTLVAVLILVARLSLFDNPLYVAVDVLYIIFMITTDLPMYWARHVADRQYRSVRDGLQLRSTTFIRRRSTSIGAKRWLGRLAIFQSLFGRLCTSSSHRLTRNE